MGSAPRPPSRFLYRGEHRRIKSESQGVFFWLLAARRLANFSSSRWEAYYRRSRTISDAPGMACDTDFVDGAGNSTEGANAPCLPGTPDRRNTPSLPSVWSSLRPRAREYFHVSRAFQRPPAVPLRRRGGSSFRAGILIAGARMADPPVATPADRPGLGRMVRHAGTTGTARFSGERHPRRPVRAHGGRECVSSESSGVGECAARWQLGVHRCAGRVHLVAGRVRSDDSTVSRAANTPGTPPDLPGPGIPAGARGNDMAQPGLSLTAGDVPHLDRSVLLRSYGSRRFRSHGVGPLAARAADGAGSRPQRVRGRDRHCLASALHDGRFHRDHCGPMGGRDRRLAGAFSGPGTEPPRESVNGPLVRKLFYPDVAAEPFAFLDYF